MSESHSILHSYSFARSDGGGICGLSELLILKEIMHRIGVQGGREEAPLPCDYFDLIGSSLPDCDWPGFLALC